jgi:hypothetical protein
MRDSGFRAAAVLMAAFFLISAPAAAAPPVVPDHVTGYSVIPPGQSGFATINQLLSGTLGPHLTDQRMMYGALARDENVTEAELETYFHSFAFGPGATIEREYTPTPGATVYRDGFGIPHIFGETDEAAFRALGYVTAEDRLWQMDVFRHAARGRLAELLGSDFVSFDKIQRRDNYTTREFRRMFESLDQRVPNGAVIEAAVAAYTEGINQRIEEVRADPNLKPGEYVGQFITEIDDWSVVDTAAIVVLQLRRFGETAGAELRNAALLQGLRQRLGTKLGREVFEDLKQIGDRTAPTTIPRSEGKFPSQALPPPDSEAVAIPDKADRLLARSTAAARLFERTLRRIGFRAPTSNFLAIAAAKSATGHALQLGGPQVGYQIPAFFMEVDVHSPRFDFRGAAVPGASAATAVGRGIDYAWSLTTGASDAVDIRVERLCEPNGSRPSRSSSGYRYKGRCKDMRVRTETIQVRNEEPRAFKVFRTVHGPVEDRGTVNGRPVAIVRERRFWKNELPSVSAFFSFGSNEMDSLSEFTAAVKHITMSFNVVYTDSENIAYFHAGGYPLRAPGVDPFLPSWGTGGWEWAGTMPFSRQPQMVNPERGWMANWNNKPAVGWLNGDASDWGPTQRVKLLAEMLRVRLDGAATVGLAGVVDVMREASTADARAVFLGADLLALTEGVDGTASEVRGAIAEWVAGGAHRVDRNNDDAQDFPVAVAVFDRWWEALAHRIFDDEIGDDYDLVGVPVSDEANPGGSSYYADFGNYLFKLFDANLRDQLARNYCDDRLTARRESCARLAKQTLKAVVANLVAEQGGDIATWTEPADVMPFDGIGGPSADPIPWQNRGTYNHIVEITGSR